MSTYSTIETSVSNRNKKVLAGVLVLFSLVAIGVFAVYNTQITSYLRTAATPITAASDDDCEGNYCDTYSRVVIGAGYECNDGTDAVFYIDEADPTSPNADKWYIELPGGSTCATVSECDDRWVKRPWDMSTDETDPASFGSEGGFDSADPELNPEFYNYNRVVIHYCTSDAHLGTVTAEENDSDWSFLGANNAFGMLAKLHDAYPGFSTASRYLFNGVSVGGTGILNLADEFANILQGYGSSGDIFFISDCGWDLIEWDCVDDCTQVACPEEEPDCNEETETTEDTEDSGDTPNTGGLGGDTIEKQEFLNAECLAAGHDNNCQYGEVVFQYIQNHDNFVVSQQLYDSQMMPWDRFIPVESWTDYQIEWCEERTDYVLSTYTDNGVTNAFSSNCRTHDFTEKNAVYTTEISGSNLPSSLVTLMDTGLPFYLIDDDKYPESNPTCDLTVLEEPPDGYVYESCSECKSF